MILEKHWFHLALIGANSLKEKIRAYIPPVRLITYLRIANLIDDTLYHDIKLILVQLYEYAQRDVLQGSRPGASVNPRISHL